MKDIEPFILMYSNYKNIIYTKNLNFSSILRYKILIIIKSYSNLNMENILIKANVINFIISN